VTLLLLPGIDGTEVLFRPLVAALPGWITPRVVTYPATGPNGYADLLPLVERSAADAPKFFVLGWSFSGPLALMLAARQPSRARGVILCSSFVRAPVPATRWLRFATVAPTVALVRLARRAPARVFGPRSHALAEAQAMTWSRVPSRVVAQRARAILALDAREILRRCPSPLLYMAASSDRVVPRHNADEVVRERPGARIATIDGDHLALFTNARAAAQTIAGFIEGTPGRRA
jgi:pimeloyl-ACP methyl ester carboxylesterase